MELEVLSPCAEHSKLSSTRTGEIGGRGHKEKQRLLQLSCAFQPQTPNARKSSRILPLPLPACTKLVSHEGKGRCYSLKRRREARQPAASGWERSILARPAGTRARVGWPGWLWHSACILAPRRQTGHLQHHKATGEAETRPNGVTQPKASGCKKNPSNNHIFSHSTGHGRAKSARRDPSRSLVKLAPLNKPRSDPLLQLKVNDHT